MKTARNIFHSILGFTVAYWVCNNTGVYDMNEAASIFLSIIAGAFTGMIIGVAIEYFQNVVLKQVFDEMDVLRTIIGAVIGGLVQAKDVVFIQKYMMIGCIVICILELLRIIYNKIKSKYGHKKNINRS